MGMIQDFQKADKERRREVAALAKEADTMVRDLTKGSAQRRSEVATMVNDLAKGDAERASEVATMESDFAKADTERASEVATMESDFAKADTERASEVATIANEADTLVKDFTKGSAQRRSDVATMVEDLARGSAQRHTDVWGVAPARKMAPPPVAELPEEMPAEAPAGELRDMVFAYLADHPDGIKLVEMEEKFGVARIQIAKVIRTLIDDSLIEKRELLYFAI